MVRTPRHQPPPPQLVSSGPRWTRRWEEIHAGQRQGDWATPSAKKALKGALETLAHGKCVFCESLLGVTAHLEIEHYVAKTVEPARAFEWTNLLPACGKCNGAKGDTDHNGVLLKPDDEDPEPCFWIYPGTGELEPHPSLDETGRRRAELTRDICDLNRGALVSQRYELYRRIGRWLNRASECGDELTDDLVVEIEELLRPQAEYKLVLRHLLERRGRADLAQEDRRRFKEPPQTTSSFTGSQRTLRSRR